VSEGSGRHSAEEDVEGLRSGTGTNAPIWFSVLTYVSLRTAPSLFRDSIDLDEKIRPHHLGRHLQNRCRLVLLEVVRVNLAVGVDVGGIPKVVVATRSRGTNPTAARLATMACHACSACAVISLGSRSWATTWGVPKVTNHRQLEKPDMTWACMGHGSKLRTP
jgi:hypothetical protein